MTNDAPQNVVRELAPGGTLRAAINFGNTVLAQKDPVTGEPRGVSAELARELARRLDVPIEFVSFDAAGKVFDALAAGGLSPRTVLSCVQQFGPLLAAAVRRTARPARAPLVL